MAVIIPITGKPPPQPSSTANEFILNALDSIHELQQYIALLEIELEDERMEKELLSRELAGVKIELEMVDYRKMER
jgi:hypothetical protein